MAAAGLRPFRANEVLAAVGRGSMGMVPPMLALIDRTTAADRVPPHPRMAAAASADGDLRVGALAVGRETPTRYHIVGLGLRVEARGRSREWGPDSAPP